jgi:hypothetical protein
MYVVIQQLSYLFSTVICIYNSKVMKGVSDQGGTFRPHTRPGGIERGDKVK